MTYGLAEIGDLRYTMNAALIYIYLRLFNLYFTWFTVLQRSLFLKLQPALIYIYLRLFESVLHVIYSLAAISFLKTSTRVHIYLSPSLQSELHVFTVSQWSLFLKLQPALIYIYTRLYNRYFTYLETVSQWSGFLKTSTCAHIYLSYVFAICTSRFYSLAAISEVLKKRDQLARL